MNYLQLLAVVLAAGAANAQSLENPVIDVGTVRTCYESTLSHIENPKCVGDASNVCQQQPLRGDTLGITKCTLAEAAIWDDFLNEEYQKLIRYFDENDLPGPSASSEELITSLREAQRAWIAFRDADCWLRYKINQAGTIRSVVSSYCHLDMTARRALVLRDLLKP